MGEQTWLWRVNLGKVRDLETILSAIDLLSDAAATAVAGTVRLTRQLIPSFTVKAAERLLAKAPGSKRAWGRLQLRISGQLIATRRRRLSYKYLRGQGLEIGAMHLPLPVPPSARVRYVDRATRAEALKAFPELDPSKVIEPDIVEDGFTLASVPDESEDFLIACHVLEHSPNPIQALENWWRVLRPGGCLFLVVPLRDHCFDRGRELTSVAHFLRDYDLVRSGDEASFATANFDHYLEWTTISQRSSMLETGESIEAARTRAANLAKEKGEIHFHTFSVDSFRELLETFGGRLETPTSLLEVTRLSAEALAIVRKAAPRAC